MEDSISRQQAIIEEEVGELRRITDALTKNMTRALRLLHQSIKLEDKIDNQDEFLEYMYDIARATIVFMHASFETALRALVAIKLRESTDLSFIPFPNRKEKMTLSELSNYRDRSVRELLDESIDLYLSNLSFNNSDDIADVFSRLKIPQEKILKYYSNLASMMKRRHQIVHEADLKRSPSTFELEKIEIDDIHTWHDSITGFYTELVNFIAQDVYVKRAARRLNENGFSVKPEDINISVIASTPILPSKAA
jgi:hypothetical protein